MQLRSVRIEELELGLVEPFRTSFGTERRRRFLLVGVESTGGLLGWGECVASLDPLYSEESLASAKWMLKERLVPMLFHLGSPDPASFARASGRFRGNRMAKAGLELALWDLAALQSRRSLSRQLGGSRGRVEVGVSVGIQPSIARLLQRVGGYLQDGYRRIKIKVEPGWDVAPLRALRAEFPEIPLWVDANQAYPTRALDRIRSWAERYELEQVEQPFAERSIRAHARLARGAPFRVCLDESIVDRASLEDAVEAGALTSLNVKVGRLGGLGEALYLGRRARLHRIPAWVGGMLESGIGRASNLALASCAPFSLPADISASARYYAEDLIDEPFELGPGSTLAVPRGHGIGVSLSERAHRRALRDRILLRP